MGLGVFVLFQNFTTLPLSALKPDFAQALARPVSPTDGTGDIRRLAPPRVQQEEKPSIASPQSGTDLNSISQDWLTRQSHLITGGAEERLLQDINKKLERLVTPSKTDEQNETLADDANAPTSEKSDEPAHASSKGNRGPASVPRIVMEKARQSDTGISGMRLTSVRVMSINRVQVGLANKTQLSCSFSGDSMQWNVSRPVSKDFDLNLRHETGQAKSSVQLNYSW
jgi:hypothetical protein